MTCCFYPWKLEYSKVNYGIIMRYNKKFHISHKQKFFLFISLFLFQLAEHLIQQIEHWIFLKQYENLCRQFDRVEVDKIIWKVLLNNEQDEILIIQYITYYDCSIHWIKKKSQICFKSINQMLISPLYRNKINVTFKPIQLIYIEIYLYIMDEVDFDF